MNKTNLHPVSHYFRVIVKCWSNCRFWQRVPSLMHSFGLNLWTRIYKFSVKTSFYRIVWNRLTLVVHDMQQCVICQMVAFFVQNKAAAYIHNLNVAHSLNIVCKRSDAKWRGCCQRTVLVTQLLTCAPAYRVYWTGTLSTEYGRQFLLLLSVKILTTEVLYLEDQTRWSSETHSVRLLVADKSGHNEEIRLTVKTTDHSD